MHRWGACTAAGRPLPDTSKCFGGDRLPEMHNLLEMPLIALRLFVKESTAEDHACTGPSAAQETMLGSALLLPCMPCVRRGCTSPAVMMLT